MTIEQRMDRLQKRNKRLAVALKMAQTDKQQAEIDELLKRQLELKIKQARQRVEREARKFQSRQATCKKDAVFDRVRAKRVIVTNDTGDRSHHGS